MKIRAHHLLCIPRFYSGGYNKNFGKNLKKICFKIRKNPDLKIKVLKKCDDICKACPHIKDSICKQTPTLNYWVIAHDKRVLRELKLKENSIHKAKDIFNISINRINGKKLKLICKGCIFLNNCIKVGLNKSFIKELNKK